MNVADSEQRPVLVPAGNRARSMAKVPKPAKPTKDAGVKEEKMAWVSTATADKPLLEARVRASTLVKRHELLSGSNLSLNTSCASDCSVDSFRSRASTGRITNRPGLPGRRRPGLPKPDKILSKVEKIGSVAAVQPTRPELFEGKRRCPWVTPNTDPCYAAFHDEEWGVPVHDDKKLFEMLVLCGALAELTWPAILNKRHVFREIFVDFDPVAVSKLNEKKIMSRESTAISLLSEPKIRAIMENARQFLKIIDEFGSFDKYCWNFVNSKPIINRFRYPRQVPVKTPKADAISKDLMKRGFRCAGPTVIYSFMQVAGLTNDHLVSCHRFEECCALATDSEVRKEEEGQSVHEVVGNFTPTMAPDSKADEELVRSNHDGEGTAVNAPINYCAD